MGNKKRDNITVIPLFKMGGRAVSNRRPPEPQLVGLKPNTLTINQKANKDKVYMLMYLL